jgi:hypothetical protein
MHAVAWELYWTNVNFAPRILASTFKTGSNLNSLSNMGHLNILLDSHDLAISRTARRMCNKTLFAVL